MIYETLVNDFVKEVTTFKCHTDSFTVVWQLYSSLVGGRLLQIRLDNTG